MAQAGVPRTIARGLLLADLTARIEAAWTDERRAHLAY